MFKCRNRIDKRSLGKCEVLCISPACDSNALQPFTYTKHLPSAVPFFRNNSLQERNSCQLSFSFYYFNFHYYSHGFFLKMVFSKMCDGQVPWHLIVRIFHSAALLSVTCFLGGQGRKTYLYPFIQTMQIYIANKHGKKKKKDMNKPAQKKVLPKQN